VFGQNLKENWGRLTGWVKQKPPKEVTEDG
jgi:hypothetical protein